MKGDICLTLTETPMGQNLGSDWFLFKLARFTQVYVKKCIFNEQILHS
jgi:hypothetical protein